MSIMIGQHEFEGPISNLRDVPHEGGVYALLHRDQLDYLLIDVEQSDNLIQSLSKHFTHSCDQQIVFLKCDSLAKRKAIIIELSKEFDFDEAEAIVASTAKRRTELNSGIALSV